MSSPTWPEFCTNADSVRSCLAPLARYARDTCKVEDDAESEACCSNRTVLLNLSSCSSYAVSDPRSPMWKSLNMLSSCCLSSSPDATACRSDICSSFLGSTNTSPCTSFHSNSFSVFHSPSCRSAVRCLRYTTRTVPNATVSFDVCRQHVESSRFNLRNLFNYNS